MDRTQFQPDWHYQTMQDGLGEPGAVQLSESANYRGPSGRIRCLSIALVVMASGHNLGNLIQNSSVSGWPVSACFRRRIDLMAIDD